MLKRIAARAAAAEGARFAIVAARYNPRYTDALVRFAKAELRAAKAAGIEVIRVPGAFEVPVVAARLARSGRFDVVICFGAILRGATTHADHIALSVSHALAGLQVETGVPIIHGVLMFENEEQARERCLDAKSNRGLEAARTALEMARIMKQLP